ncbi:MAG TPA: DUF4136 domain-containing protein [Planctomycetota bacterium]|nr:DUF4136 domain-containing protein [Planctomycetota bacterium]
MRLAVPTVLLALLGCSSSGVDVRGGGADPHYDFKSLKTYGWMPREDLGDPRIEEDRLDARVHAGVDAELQAKGYRLEAQGADFLVGYRAVLGRQRTVESGQAYEGIWTDDHRPSHSTTGGPAPVSKVETEGTLVLRMHDGKTRRLVWEAAADTEIEPKSGPLTIAPTTDDKVRVAVRKMLERFPP